ncbi:MAG: iron-sulfur cluster assembly accessory protein [Myxococcota bacterium]|jgi:iron-sulfur cluster assembly protein|nr:iron-sulfur cluster assembly accessory protein [Myxococcota bacterium]HIG68577.1 iron-sulfur cluster assembly accessory protein [Myxococcales bacterium]HIM00227.1 iron-sulfur cluster assembly accessory protein [Myxococcales bacterium]
MANEQPSTKVNAPLDWLPQQDAVVSEGPANQVVLLTESAQSEVRRLLEIEGQPGLRLGIKGGGCSGLSYDLSFTEENEGDTVIAFDGFNVFLDRKSTIYLSGITLDFQTGLEGRGFVFQNPQASNTCGCGESFSI